MDVSSARLRTDRGSSAEQRLAALHETGLLGAPAEERFDRLTRLARRLLGVPVALVSLLDADRQRFLSAQGLPEPWAGLRQIPLAYSFCRSVVEAGLPMSVSDAREDPRVRDNPAIKDLGVIAYLAIPLALPDGCVIGALCGIDHRPRAWTAAEEAALQDLAGAVEAEMAVGLRLREAGPAGAVLRESEARYRALFEAIDAGFCIIEMKFDGEQRPIDYRFVEVNPAFAGQTGLADAVGKWMRELAPDHEQHWFDIYGRIALTGEAVRFENVAAALGRWYDVYAFRIGEPGAHHVAILFNDISDRRRAETALRESEARYRALFDVSPQVVWFADAEGRCTYVNRHYTDFAGLPAERVLGDGWLAALHPEDRAGARAAWADAVASEGDYEVEYRIRRGADGSHRWFLVRGAPLRGPDGRIERWIGVGVDIDDRRRAEEALRASEERFRRAMGIGTVGVHFFGLDGRVTDANRAFERMSGYTRGELLALGDRKVLTPPEFSDATGRAAAELAASGETAPYEKQMVRKDGSRWWGLFAPTRLAGYGRGARCVEFVVDVTERKRAEEAWRRFAALAELSGEFVGMCDTRLAPFYVNAAGLRLVGLDGLEHAQRTPVLEFFFPDDRASIRDEFLPRVLRDGRGEVETRFRHFKTGDALWVIYSVVALADEHGRPVGYGTVTRDITGRKRAEGALRASEGRLRDLLATLDLGASMARDLDGTIRFWSEGCARLYGWSAAEAVGQDAHALLRTAFPVPRAEIGAALERDGEWTGDLRQWTRDGAEVVVAARKMLRRHPDGRPVAVLESLTDVSAQRLIEAALRASEARLRELQAELLHVSRLSAAGEMAAVLAHELNQPLTAAASAVQAARRTLASASPEGFDGQPPEVREAMDLAVEQARRAGQIVRRLRDFVARGEADPRLESLPRLVEEAAALALVGAGERGVAVALRVEPGLPPVLADRIQIEQVLFNLMRNALEAMDDGEPAAGSGRDAPRHRELVLSAELAGPGEVEIAVADTGPGLAPEVAGRLFEPFVSTKPEGMGVGLSICRSIVEAHGGRLWAEPNPEGGTVFRFTLPAARPPESRSSTGERGAAR